MGERKGQNKYYPPDFNPQKHRSLDNYHGTHPLRERARKLNKGILIIRFEMPYNIWCGGCGRHIAMGVRYNAEKSKVGMYYTTPIYKFRMRCHLCEQYFEIKTDPQNHDYVIISGAQRKEQRWDPKENEQVAPDDKEIHKKLELDAMYKLEHGSEDKKKSTDLKPVLASLEEFQGRQKDDYLLNKLNEKKATKLEEDTDNALLKKSSLSMKLVKETEDDKRMASLLKYQNSESYDDVMKRRRNNIAKSAIFPQKQKPTSADSSPLATLRRTAAQQLQSRLSVTSGFGVQKNDGPEVDNDQDVEVDEKDKIDDAPEVEQKHGETEDRLTGESSDLVDDAVNRTLSPGDDVIGVQSGPRSREESTSGFSLLVNYDDSSGENSDDGDSELSNSP